MQSLFSKFYTQWTNSRTRAKGICTDAIYTHTRTIYLRTDAVYFYARTVYLRTLVIYFCTHAVYSCTLAVYFCTRAVYSCTGASYFRTRAVYLGARTGDALIFEGERWKGEGYLLAHFIFCLFVSVDSSALAFVWFTGRDFDWDGAEGFFYGAWKRLWIRKCLLYYGRKFVVNRAACGGV